MATVNQDLVKKFQQISVRQQGDGVEVEVRQDEEQGVKLQEIIDLLVAAGYFRARIKGLSPFDKVVGGMTWCIELCNVDVDVDLLFQENSTIGQKIALTEKIVAVLPQLKCPHLIEPHQIQGLDFIHIYPVIQWLVKRSLEYRKEMSTYVRSFALNQFYKEFPNKNEEVEKENKLLQNILRVNNFYRPRSFTKNKKLDSNNKDDSFVDDLVEDTSEDIKQFLCNVEDDYDDYFFFDDLDPLDKERLVKLYYTIKEEAEDGKIRSKEEEKILILEEQKRLIDERCSKLELERNQLKQNIRERRTELQVIHENKLEVEKSFQELEVAQEKDPESVKEIEDLVILNDSLRAKEVQFKEKCKKELVELQSKIEEKKKAKTPVLNEEENQKEIEVESEKLRVIKLQLAKKNRTIAALQRQLDDVPSRAELAQYQRRFLELYNQVAAKHKETKQYYTLYNTLEDTSQYMKREISLLNSISDSYPEAMQTTSGKEEFLKQFESIVESVRLSKSKVDRRLSEEKYKRDQLSAQLHTLVDLQRKYAAALKQLSIECKKHENNVNK